MTELEIFAEMLAVFIVAGMLGCFYGFREKRNRQRDKAQTGVGYARLKEHASVAHVGCNCTESGIAEAHKSSPGITEIKFLGVWYEIHDLNPDPSKWIALKSR